MKKKKLLAIAAILSLLFSFLFIIETTSNKNNHSLDEKNFTQGEKVPKEIPAIDEDQVQLNAMTLDEKIGQLLIVGYPDSVPNDLIKTMITKEKIGGFIFFKRNYQDLETLIHVTNQLNEWNTHNPLPLFMSVDEEGGSVSRIPKEGTKFPDARLLGKIDDQNLTYKMGEVMGKELKAIGFNLNYAPVLDIVFSKDNKLLIKRSFGKTPEIVAKHGVSFIEGLQSQGVIASPKHFPGHGDTIVDSHGKLPKIMIDKTTLLNRELIPFQRAVDAGADAIMVGHLSFPHIDPSGLPATKSNIFLKDILRDELDFDGLIITDEIEMIGYMNKETSLRDSIIQSINGGVDIFVVGHTYDIQMEILNIIKDAVKNHVISEDRIDQSVLRIIKVKNKYHLRDNSPIDIEESKKIIGSQKHKSVLEEIIRREKN